MRTFLLALGVLAITIALVGCGGDDDEPSASRTATEQSETTDSDTAPTTADEDSPPTETEAADDTATTDDTPTTDDEQAQADDQPPADDDRAQTPSDDSGDDQPSNSGSSDANAKAAGQTVVAFFGAMSAGDGEKACSLLADRVKEEIAKGLSQSPQYQGKDCAAALSAISKNYTDAARTDLTRIKVTKTRPKGEAVLVTYRGGSIPQATMPVVHEDGSWKVGAPTGTP